MLTREAWVKKLCNAAVALKANADMLSKLDAETGDGDHGVTIARMAQLINDSVSNWDENTTIGAFLDDLSFALLNVNGGSAGPLWGTMFGGMAEAGGGGDTDAAALKSMFSGALAAMPDVTSAKIGQKTLMDALIPACEAAAACEGDVEAILQAAAAAAEIGAEKTREYVARFGRAKNLKEKSLGHLDPGAVSLAILLRGLT